MDQEHLVDDDGLPYSGEDILSCTSDDDPYGAEELDTLRSIKHSREIELSITANYTTDWKPREAFREFIQNWQVWNGLLPWDIARFREKASMVTSIVRR